MKTVQLENHFMYILAIDLLSNIAAKTMPCFKDNQPLKYIDEVIKQILHVGITPEWELTDTISACTAYTIALGRDFWVIELAW